MRRISQRSPLHRRFTLPEELPVGTWLGCLHRFCHHLMKEDFQAAVGMLFSKTLSLFQLPRCFQPFLLFPDIPTFSPISTAYLPTSVKYGRCIVPLNALPERIYTILPDQHLAVKLRLYRALGEACLVPIRITLRREKRPNHWYGGPLCIFVSFLCLLYSYISYLDSPLA